jgi:membrane-bound lytic murein transglycosylase B
MHAKFVLFLLAALNVMPALAIDTQRKDVQEFIGEMTGKYSFKSADLRSLLRNAESKPAIIEAINRPAEKVLSWYEYRDHFLTERRINKGVEFWTRQAAQLNRATETTGVSADAIVGILGVETLFGEITGRYRVLDALVTLSFDYPPRGKFFRGELEQFLLLTREEKVDARKALGSYAGAIGAPQFMPSSYRKLAVDGDGNGRRDLWTSWPDIVMSVANYFKSNGWRAGEPVVASANVDAADLPTFDTSELRLNETVATLRAKGARFETSQPDDTPAMLIVTEGRDGNEYRIGFHNFIVITRYNPRIKYALAVNDLGVAVARAREDAGR